jgi:hypothetical protein
MSSQAAPDSPLVTYPPDAARPGYNYRDYFSPDPIYVPVPGDEGFVDQMTDLEIAERSESSSVAQSDISQIAAGSSTSLWPGTGEVGTTHGKESANAEITIVI